MKSFALCLSLLVVAAGLTGCVSQAALDQQREMTRAAQSRVVELETELERLQSQIDAMRAAASSDSAAAAQLAAALAEIERLQGELALLSVGPGTTLPPDLRDALEKLAQKYPGLMTFDADRKMIKMQSDLTFDLGSDKVKPQAAQSLASLAQVLKSSEAQVFDIKVLGHTDNVPVTNPANRQRYGDNWGLSAARAKSVMQVLKKAGVTENRFEIAGRGAQQPVVPNPARGGAQANRRVEIFLVPAYAAGSAPVEEAPAGGAASAPADGSSTTSEGPEMFK